MGISAVIDLLLELVLKATKISQLVAAAQARGEELSPAELAQARQLAHDANKRLSDLLSTPQ